MFKSPKVSQVLESSASAATIVLCCLAVFSVYTQYSAGRESSRAAAGRPSSRTFPVRATQRGASVGDRLQKIIGVEYAQSERTLLIFLDPDCIVCKLSLSDYSDLKAHIAAGNLAVQAIGVVTEQAVRGLAELQTAGFPFPVVTTSTFERFGVSGTPTLIVVDRQGQIRNVWVGKLNSQVMSAVKRALGEQRGA